MYNENRLFEVVCTDEGWTVPKIRLFDFESVTSIARDPNTGNAVIETVNGTFATTTSYLGLRALFGRYLGCDVLSAECISTQMLDDVLCDLTAKESNEDEEATL